jgi:hypothetical protein
VTRRKGTGSNTPSIYCVHIGREIYQSAYCRGLNGTHCKGLCLGLPGRKVHVRSVECSRNAGVETNLPSARGFQL